MLKWQSPILPPPKGRKVCVIHIGWDGGDAYNNLDVGLYDGTKWICGHGIVPTVKAWTYVNFPGQM